jgi:hypothetical protein
MKLNNFVTITLCAITTAAPNMNAQIPVLRAQSGIPTAPPVTIPAGPYSTHDQQATQVAQAAPAALPEKKPGMVRIGVPGPAAQMGQPGQDVGGLLQTMLIQYLSGPMIEVTPIFARAPQQIEAEAKQKNCDFVLSASLSQKTGSSGLGAMRGMASMASMIPMVGAVAGVGGAIASAAAGAAMSGAAGLSGMVKAKSELTFAYKLAAPGNTESVLSKSLKAKAKTDGEDLITPMVNQAATDVLTELSKDKPSK